MRSCRCGARLILNVERQGATCSFKKVKNVQMLITRRQWLSISAGSAYAALAFPCRVEAQDGAAGPVERRISLVIREYEQQGFHRTGTAVDKLSGDWLCEEVRQAGLAPTLESFSLSRVDSVTNVLIAGGRRIEGVPLFDGAFTDARGVRGRMGALESDAEIGLAETATNAAASGPLGDARRTNRHKAIVAVTRGGRPGLCLSNADSFLQPFGPPVLQVSSEHAPWLSDQAQRGAEVHLIAQVKRTAADAVNVTARINGANPGLPPLVVMTPRSGWYSCASERGGGIACWLEIIRALNDARPARTVLFVASSGHELGHLGINAFVDRRPGIVLKSVGWMHLGASIGAAIDPRNTLQASDDEFDAILSRAMTSAALSVDRRIPRGTIPTGEAEVVHRGGGRYVSMIGRSALFHNPEDRGPQAVDVSAIANFSTAFIAVARMMAGA
jgi:hypothetical protein